MIINKQAVEHYRKLKAGLEYLKFLRRSGHKVEDGRIEKLEAECKEYYKEHDWQ